MTERERGSAGAREKMRAGRLPLHRRIVPSLVLHLPLSRSPALPLSYLAGAVLAAAPWLIDNQFVLLMISLTGIAYLVALGLNLVMGFGGQVSLGHAALFGVGAYASAILTLRYEQPFVLGLLAAGLAAGLVGVLLGIPSLRLAGPYLAMATMAFNLIAQRLMVNWADLTGGPDGLPGLPGARIGPIVFDRRTYVYLVAVVALGGLFVARNLVGSRYGRGLLAMREDELAASSLGVNLYRAKLLAFGLSAVYAGLAGSLFAHLYRHISPISFGLEASLEFLLAVILAGPSTLVWPLVGALFVTVLPQLPALQGLQDLRLLVYGALLLLSVILLPRGLGGAFRAVTHSPARSRPPPSLGEGASPLSEPSVERAGTPLLRLESVTRRFGGVLALDGLNLAVQPGTIHGLIGPNGSGKTTALNTISGIHRPQIGRVLFDGRPITGLAPHRLASLGIARTFQNLRLFGELSVLENVQVGQHARFRPPLGTTLLGLPSARAMERVSAGAAARLASRLGLGDTLAVRAADLPHGHQRRVELARALAARPRLLLLDEPAAGLSAAEIDGLREQLIRARAAGITILLVEHHLDLVLDLCDRVTVLNRGRAIADGTPAEVRADPSVAEAYLGRGEQSPALPLSRSPALPLLTLQGVTVRYGRVTAVSDLDLVVGAGELVALLGANGAGKSTVLRAISGLVPLAAGSMHLDGRPIERDAAHGKVAHGLAHVPEGRRVFADQSVEDNLRLGAFNRYFRPGRSAIEADLEAMLRRFPALAERRRIPAGSLSGGEQQQLAIARALMARPRLLLLDEPSLGLAPILVEQVFDLLNVLRAEGVTILLVEQLAHQALRLADRAYVLRTGRCLLSGPAADVAADPRLEAAYLGASKENVGSYSDLEG